MKRDGIMRMAREAGMLPVYFNRTSFETELSAYPKELERFAALVAEAAIKDAPDYKMGYADGVAVEREACAKVCEEEAMRCEKAAQRAVEDGEHDEVSAIRSTAWKISVCAAAIRARGQA